MAIRLIYMTFSTYGSVFGLWLYRFFPDGNFEIAQGEMMDYEALSFYNISFIINDGIDDGGPFIYELTAGDDIEAPYFKESTTHL